MLKLTKKSTWPLLVLVGIFLEACVPATSAPIIAPVKATPTTQLAEEDTNNAPTLTETIIDSPTEPLVLEATVTPTPATIKEIHDPVFADILSVVANGSENAYTFAVEIRSPDTGCDQYADWWEVVTEDGALIYRRILGHSHVSEQPFTRSGGPVQIGPDEIVIVRAHMHPTGYGGTAFRGSFSGGFEEIQLEADFAPELENADPLPNGCAF